MRIFQNQFHFLALLDFLIVFDLVFFYVDFGFTLLLSATSLDLAAFWVFSFVALFDLEFFAFVSLFV